MSEMVERVARAILDNVPTISERGAYDPADLQRCARAAIEAMREPTQAMVRTLYESHGKLWADCESAVVWHAMIDAALNKTEKQ